MMRPTAVAAAAAPSAFVGGSHLVPLHRLQARRRLVGGVFIGAVIGAAVLQERIALRFRVGSSCWSVSARAPASISDAAGPRRGANSRRQAFTAAAVGVLPPLSWQLGPLLPANAAEPNSRMDARVASAVNAFQEGDYLRAQKLWLEVADSDPSNPYAWASVGTCILIRAQEIIRLEEPLSDEAVSRLQEALAALDRAIACGMERDPIVLNQRANVFNLWRRWPDAVDAYVGAVKVSPVGIASIPRQNLALARYELGDDAGAEREAAALLLRDPEFVDARALLAAIRWVRGDQVSAENSWSEICEGVRPPEPTNMLGRAVRDAGLAVGISKYVPQNGGQEFCKTYSSMSAVQGRWPPRALSAYKTFLGRRVGAQVSEGGA